MSDAAMFTATDVGTPVTGVISCADTSVDLSTITSAFLVVSGVGVKVASILSSSRQSATLQWTYDGSLSAGSYPCWWQVTFINGQSRTAPTGTSLSLQVASAN